MNDFSSMVPSHLQRYIIPQSPTQYTPVEQASWRYMLRQLRAFLSVHAHECYLKGLEGTGVTVESIPSIADISKKISQFGWTAVPVSGFIPPTAFMELQAHSILPIAADIRTISHIMYTPAPDIVHEAAGHAPILVDEDFANYLKEYAAAAKNAIISKEDLDVYAAIRSLSDLKEAPDSTPEQIGQAEAYLAQVSKKVNHLSEAAKLTRLAWWTAEYGLVGDINNPKIYGAGLLSSVGEAKQCLGPKVKKIPLTVDCVNYSYDITEPQPQLFVTPNFKHLIKVLHELTDSMAYRTGGIAGLKTILMAKTVNTVQLDSGLQIGGELAEYLVDESTGQPSYLRLSGPCQLAYNNKELSGHHKNYHAQGYSTPVGPVFKINDQIVSSSQSSGYGANQQNRCLSTLSDAELKNLGLVLNRLSKLEFSSGIKVKGTLRSRLRQDEKLILLSFEECSVHLGDRELFKPDWGTFDMAVGCQIPTVFAGPPDRPAYGEIEDFVNRRVPEKKYSADELELHQIYLDIRKIRNSQTSNETLKNFIATTQQKLSKFSQDWLSRLELLELAHRLPATENQGLKNSLVSDLEKLCKDHPEFKLGIEDGMALAHE